MAEEIKNEIQVSVVSVEDAISQGLTPENLIRVATWSYNEADHEYKKHKNDKTKDIGRAKRLKAQAKLLRDRANELKEILARKD